MEYPEKTDITDDNPGNYSRDYSAAFSIGSTFFSFLAVTPKTIHEGIIMATPAIIVGTFSYFRSGKTSPKKQIPKHPQTEGLLDKLDNNGLGYSPFPESKA